MCLEIVWRLQLFPENAVVVDFTVDRQGQGLVIVEQRLGASVYNHMIS